MKYEATRDQIKDYRRQRGMKQTDFAAEMCVAVATVRAWERESSPAPCRGLVARIILERLGAITKAMSV